MREFDAQPCTTDLLFLGECTRWDEVRHELLWVDFYAGRLYRATANGERVEIVNSYEVEGTMSAVAPLRDRGKGWIIAADQSLAILDEEGKLRELDRPEAANAPRVRMNDGVADPWGKFWIGSMAIDGTPEEGSLYRHGTRSETVRVLSGLTISNGLGWSPDGRTMYFVDSGPGTVYSFDVDDEGGVRIQRSLIQFDPQHGGIPDGLCVDAEGALWIAVWGGNAVNRYSPSGELIARVALSTRQPTSCAIGGETTTTLYIATAREDLSAEQLELEPHAGRIFCADGGSLDYPLTRLPKAKAAPRRHRLVCFWRIKGELRQASFRHVSLRLHEDVPHPVAARAKVLHSDERDCERRVTLCCSPLGMRTSPLMGRHIFQGRFRRIRY